MKKINLIEWLWKTDSHEKQKVRGMQKYCILLLLLFTCVTHAYAATRRLYYDNSSTNWGTVYCYCWKDGGSNDQNWPGKPMTRICDTHIWYRDVTDDNCNKCIFNNNNGKQTPDQDIPAENDKCTYDGESSVSWSTYQGTYIYFYAAIPNGWDNRTTTVRLTSSGSSALTPYDNTSLASTTKNASSPCVSVYSAVSSTSYYNSGAKYNVYIYKVPECEAGENVYLGHSVWTYSTAIGTVAAGKLYTLTNGDGTYMTANAISVNSVTASGPYAINAVTLTSSISAYGTSTADLRTAGGDTFTTTYTLNDQTASTSTVITPSVSNTYTSNTGNLAGSISIDASDLIAGHTYTLTVTIADNITGKMTSSATSSPFAVIASGHDITYTDESTGWTYGTKPSAAEKDATITFVVTPTDGYTVTVSSSDVELSGPNEDNEYTFTMPDKDVSINVSATENTYTVTLVNATAGSVTAGCATRPSITASTAPFGMKFDHWDVSGGASVASTTSSTTTVSATAAGTVTAVYVQSLYAYIVGRFETHSKNRQSTYYTGNWNTTATNNEFEYDETNHRFVKHTYTTLAELSANKDSNPQYFEIKTTEDHGDLSDASVKYYGKTSDIDIKTTGYEDGKIAMEQSTVTGHPKFNGSTTDKYVVIYLDKDYNLWFEEEAIPASINNVALSVSRVPPTAPITATPTMYVRGAVNKAYCWGVYTDEECTNKVNSVTFSSLGDGKVQFMAPQTQGTYYLKLTVHSTDDCNATIDDEEVVSFTVTTSQMVFFKNVPGWGNVHFYFLGGEYWDNNEGSGCAGRDGGAARGMTRIGNSDVYYYDYSNNSVMTTYLSSHSTCHIAFTDNYKPNANNFSGCQAAYRGDFSECATMYVPENYITDYKNTSAGDGQCAYYNRGYWTKYMDSGSAYTLHVYDAKDRGTEVFSHEFTGTAGVNTYSYTYDFKDVSQSMSYIYYMTLVGCNGSTYGSADDMDISKCSNWNFYTDTRRCGLKVQAKLKHTFILTLTGDGHIQLSVEYPISVGDYRLLYDDDTQNPHPSQFIRKRTHDTDTVFKDTVSMYIRPSAATKTLKVQTCTGISGETITWADYNWTGSDATGAINVSSKTDGVYNFYLEQDKTGKLTVNTTETKPYSGKYYIRTNCLDGGWNSYKTSSDNLMTYAQYPEDRGYGFNYYKAKWVGSTGTDVTYTIACDYSPSLCDTLTADPGDNPLSASEAASLPHTANIRFGWHSKTNQLKREYINGSTNVSDRFLVMMGDTKLKDKDGNALAISGLNANEISFTDLNNWIYRCDIQAQTGAAVKLQATYDGHEQYFIGGADKTEVIIGGSSGEWHGMRVTYDFKTNRLMTAWLPNGSEIESDVVLNADMMLIREGQNAATQVYFKSSGISISDIHTIYGVMEFKYDHMVGKFPNWNADGAYEYLMYYISFPFDVKVSEIFGCGVRGENWIIQKYNGAKRAQIGWFAETSTFWETMEGDETMNAYEGYLLLLDRVTFNDPSSSLWYKQGSDNSIYLYFPSKSVTSGTISERDTTIHVPEHTCTINRTFTVDGVPGTLNHKNTDSHWNIMGTPLFQTASASEIGTPADGDGATTLQYFYRWDYSDNSIDVEDLCDTTTFKSMHSYMVQYAGDVTFHGAKLTPPPASVAARRVPSDKNYRIELRMVNANNKFSRTYVELRENACDTFVLNEDLYKVRSSKMVDLYTFAGAYDVAANVLSVNNHIVPVGMDVKQAGTYRFTMPSDFSGTVTLIDTQAGARTNLALGDYEVNLEKGTLNNRFQLEINIQASTTSLEGNDVKDGGAHKFIENGAMYILKNGEIFDVYGNHVR